MAGRSIILTYIRDRHDRSLHAFPNKPPATNIIFEVVGGT